MNIFLFSHLGTCLTCMQISIKFSLLFRVPIVRSELRVFLCYAKLPSSENIFWLNIHLIAITLS